MQLRPEFNFEKDFAGLTDQDEFQNSLSIYPIYDHTLIYKLNMYFAAVSFSLNSIQSNYI